MERLPCPIRDVSDQGRCANKRLRYEVLYYCTPAASNGNESPDLVAKFRSYGDALRWAQQLAVAPATTEVLIRC